jgi:FlgD Ig-like domain
MFRIDINSWLRRWLVMSFVAAALALPALAQLTLDWYTIDGGGHTFSSNGSYRLGGTCGQPDAGSMSGSQYDLRGGFWRGGTPASAVYEDPDFPEVVDLPGELRIVTGLMNPFRYETGIRLELPVPHHVAVNVFDHSGRLIRRLHNAETAAGTHRLAWNGTDDRGQRVASGIYLLHVRAGDQVSKRRVVLMR